MTAPKPTLVSVTRDGSFQINYELSDGSSSAFRVVPTMADFIMQAWAWQLVISPPMSGSEENPE